MNKSEITKAYLSIWHNPQTKLVHGALFRNQPTPSGSDRYLLSLTTKEGYRSERKAAEAINAAFPDITPMPLDDLVDLGAVIDGFEADDTIVHVRPKDGEADWVEVRPRNWTLVSDTPLKEIEGLTPTSLSRLQALRILEMDGSSGNDPELSCIYDYYQIATPSDY